MMGDSDRRMQNTLLVSGSFFLFLSFSTLAKAVVDLESALQTN